MPFAKVDETLDMYYRIDSFVEPWREPEMVLLVHGLGGSVEEWFAWVPPLSGKYAVLRIDLRGWGRSSIPPEGYVWSMKHFADDIARFMDSIGIRKVHFVGTKLGGRIGLHFACHYPQKLHSLTLVCTPMTLRINPNDSRSNRPETDRGSEGVRKWARDTMKERLGECPPEMIEWWNQLYGKSSPRVISEIYDVAWNTDEFELLKFVKAPTLVIDSNAQMDISEIEKWQMRIRDSRLASIPITTEGRQISASKPAECAAELVSFLEELSRKYSG